MVDVDGDRSLFRAELLTPDRLWLGVYLRGTGQDPDRICFEVSIEDDLLAVRMAEEPQGKLPVEPRSAADLVSWPDYLGMFTPWTTAGWFQTGNTELGGRAPTQALREDDLPAVLALAWEIRSHDA